MNLTSDFARTGHLATRMQLKRLGHSDNDIRRAIVDGRFRPVGRSWLAGAEADAAAVRAVEARGVLGGESALRSLGIWVTTSTGLCIATPHSASRLPDLLPGEYRVQSRRPVGTSRGRLWRASPIDALEQHLRRVDSISDGIASVDSAVRMGFVPAHRVDELFERLPRRLRRNRSLVNALADSGLETLLRLAAMAQGWRVDVQVQVDGVGRVDLVIDGWLVIEIDGDFWHATRDQRERDRMRDAALVLRGMRYHRFGYQQVMHDLDGCIAVIRELLVAGRPTGW